MRNMRAALAIVLVIAFASLGCGNSGNGANSSPDALAGIQGTDSGKADSGPASVNLDGAVAHEVALPDSPVANPDAPFSHDLPAGSADVQPATDALPGSDAAMRVALDAMGTSEAGLDSLAPGPTLLDAAADAPPGGADRRSPGTGGTGGSGADGSTGCPAGSETCACYGNSSCNAGLTCASNLCVNLGTGGTGGTSSGGAGGGGTSGMSTGGQSPGTGGSGGAGGNTSCPAGSETCACYGNGSCNAGLTCASNLCVNLGTGGTGGTGGAGGTGGTSGACQEGATQCLVNSVQTCSNGQWGAAVACGARQTCAGTPGAVQCTCKRILYAARSGAHAQAQRRSPTACKMIRDASTSPRRRPAPTGRVPARLARLRAARTHARPGRQIVYRARAFRHAPSRPTAAPPTPPRPAPTERAAARLAWHRAARTRARWSAGIDATECLSGTSLRHVPSGPTVARSATTSSLLDRAGLRALRYPGVRWIQTGPSGRCPIVRQT